MGGRSFATKCITFSCLICSVIASELQIQNSSRPAKPRSITSPISRDRDAVSSLSFSVDLQPYQNELDRSVSVLKTAKELGRMQNKVNSYIGKSQPGISTTQLKRNFLNKMQSSVAKHLNNSVGGIIQEFGEMDFLSLSSTCLERPTLKLEDVRQLARISFNISDLELSYPSCNFADGASEVACTYGTGKCCTRPQVEFIGRYYDTAVASMALGATADEAFAPLVHARVLAYAPVV